MTDEPRPPPPGTIADFIKLQRAIIRWKQQTLASKARVSLSTVERVERGEAVSSESLEKLAEALNQRPGAFTEPRVPLSTEKALQNLLESLSWTNGRVPVKVAPFRRQAQLRDLVHTDLLVMDSDLEEDAAGDLNTLREWLDLTGFIRAEDGSFLPKRERDLSLRDLYRDVFNAVQAIERQYKAVCLVGTYEAKSNFADGRTVRVAVVAARSRVHNPACSKISTLMAEEVVDAKAAFRAWMKEDS